MQGYIYVRFAGSMHGVANHCSEEVSSHWFAITFDMLAACTCPLHVTATAAWLESGTLQRVVMVVTNAATQEVVERWTFSVETNAAADG